MKKNKYIIYVLISFMLIIFTSCKDDKSDLTEMYKTDKRIIPLSEYTLDNPREWKDIADEHIPQFKMTTLKGKDAIYIEVKLKKPSMEHYIEKIGILNEKGREIVSKSFPRVINPKSHAFFYLMDLPKNKKLKIFAKCNLHDLWMTPLILKK